MVWLRDDEVCGIMLRPNYLGWIHRTIQEDGTAAPAPEELPPFLKNKKGNFHVMESCLSGSDGRRSRSGKILILRPIRLDDRVIRVREELIARYS